MRHGRSLGSGGCFRLALPRQIAQFKVGGGFYVITKVKQVLGAEEEEEVQYGENKHVENNIYRGKQRSKS